MARAEYLKEQVKVGMWGPTLGRSYVRSVPLCPWLSVPCSLCCDSLSLLSEGLSSQSVLYVLQMKESHWEAETLDKEGLSESVRSCESCPGV